MLAFALPMVLGNLLQQLYNVADTLIVGKVIGADALAAVGASFTLMVFLTSVILGMCMGSGVVLSMLFGAKEEEKLKTAVFWSFLFTGTAALIINLLALCTIDPILTLLQIPVDIRHITREYLQIIFYGILFAFIYNYFASLLRAVGSSVPPLIFLAVSAVLNIVLDLVFILVFHMGVSGAAIATVIAQGVSAVGIAGYTFYRVPVLKPSRRHMHFDGMLCSSIVRYSVFTSMQQSIMNFGILMIQGLVNSFGVKVMAAFAAAVKIDSFAYLPVQDFGNAFSTFIAQNYGAKKNDRIRKGIRMAAVTTLVFCAVISIIVCLSAEDLMLIFVRPTEKQILAIGAQYLRIVGMCYAGIGGLFLLYGLYRGLGRAGMSVILTIISLGTRVVLAYLLAPVAAIGLLGIWWAIPIGWLLADVVGVGYYIRKKRNWFQEG